MRALLIVNPNATSTSPAGRDLLAHALASTLTLSVAHTTHRGHAAELAHHAGTDGTDLIIVHGGDGTVNEVVNGLLGPPSDAPLPHVPFAVVPGGSANVFARALGVAADPLVATNQLIDLLATRQRRRIGLGSCGDRWFTFNAGLGLDAAVCKRVEDHRERGVAATSGQYVRSAIRTFFTEKRSPARLTVALPGAEPIDGVHYSFVSNTSPWTYLDERPVHTNPGTSFDTGLGIFAMRTMGVIKSLRTARNMLAEGGDPTSPDLVRADDVDWIRITASEPMPLQLDGDYLGERDDVEFRSVPDALDVIAPAAE
ncbi:diacylglycerol kinase family lipid kinase [Rhodococcus rhodnii]|uniref:DAGKc domain-containing protein n=2 Tax=Rhodococcus rhodnii TaxID=38312 RepID=R7WJ97_9NOCA|nr:diacylglycerol kinase family protein [Rhodococcus rhodnii]EOM75347.1 hypothetical protein Rrhod_3145 [Rhodococcus rhodnii LMG 5362]TXG90600.1 diacylglycerol kinase family lipid kinase [Rhodococcus rhodnii]